MRLLSGVALVCIFSGSAQAMVVPYVGKLWKSLVSHKPVIFDRSCSTSGIKLHGLPVSHSIGHQKTYQPHSSLVTPLTIKIPLAASSSMAKNHQIVIKDELRERLLKRLISMVPHGHVDPECNFPLDDLVDDILPHLQCTYDTTLVINTLWSRVKMYCAHLYVASLPDHLTDLQKIDLLSHLPTVGQLVREIILDRPVLMQHFCKKNMLTVWDDGFVLIPPQTALSARFIMQGVQSTRSKEFAELFYAEVARATAYLADSFARRVDQQRGDYYHVDEWFQAHHFFCKHSIVFIKPEDIFATAYAAARAWYADHTNNDLNAAQKREAFACRWALVMTKAIVQDCPQAIQVLINQGILEEDDYLAASA